MKRFDRRLWPVILMGAALVIETGLLVWPLVRRHVLAQKTTAVERGQEIAWRMGCFTCHGPLGKSGIRNPGSAEGEVPAWDGGTYMMYVASPEEVREWILFGAPKRKLDDPDYRRKAAQALVRMPSYEGLLTGGELEDLIAFYEAVAWVEKPPADAAAGRFIARTQGCFSCHGEDGRARQPNPGSFKGYIPSWEGEDFSELVRDETELRTWIQKGGLPRLLENPAARFFIERQRIQMPAYEGVLSEKQIDQIVAYVRWLRQRKPNR